MYRKWYQVNLDVSILDFKDLTFCDVTDQQRWPKFDWNLHSKAQVNL